MTNDSQGGESFVSHTREGEKHRVGSLQKRGEGDRKNQGKGGQSISVAGSGGREKNSS